MDFTRYALYVAPPPKAAWTRAATAWLGWDMTEGRTVPHPDLAGLDLARITETPRRYGLHGTIKPPFRLAPGTDATALHAACAALCARLSPVPLPGLALTKMGRFLALCPAGEAAALTRLAATCVEALDPFRAPAPEAELARRRATGLSPAQEMNLVRWGYPYVMDQFRFHITLTGKLPAAEQAQVRAALEAHLGPLLPAPCRIDDLALVGEAPDGRFHLLHRYTLSG